MQGGGVLFAPARAREVAITRKYTFWEILGYIRMELGSTQIVVKGHLLFAVVAISQICSSCNITCNITDLQICCFYIPQLQTTTNNNKPTTNNTANSNSKKYCLFYLRLAVVAFVFVRI